MSGLTQQQVDKLLAPIKPRRVLQAQGQSHVAAHDIIAHLTRILGFGNWHTDIKELSLVHERIETDDRGKVRAWVTYRCVLRLTVKDPEGSFVCHYEDVATGSAQNMPGVGDAHDFACKNAVSYAIKRCAKNLGDQFGLSLYGNGSVAPLVGITLVQPDAHHAGDVEDHAPDVVSLGNDERQDSPSHPQPEVEVARHASDAALDAAKDAVKRARGAGAASALSSRMNAEDIPTAAGQWTEADAVRVIELAGEVSP